MKAIFAAGALAAALFAAPVGPLETAPSFPALIQDPLQHAVTVVNIAVPTRVYDGDRFVDSLTAADFEVFENGVPQKVEAAYLVRKTSVHLNAFVEGATAPVAVPVKRPDESLLHRNFVLIFEMDSFLPQFTPALDTFCSDVLAPGDTLRVITPDNTYVLNRKTLDKAARAKLAEEIKGMVRKSVTQGGMLIRSVLANLRDLDLQISNGLLDKDLGRFSARSFIQQLVALKTMNVAQFASFAKLLKPLVGQKFAFIFYQRESYAIPSLFRNIFDAEALNRMDTIDKDEVRRLFSNANTTAHFIYLTHADNSARDVEWKDIVDRDINNIAPAEMAGDFFQSFRNLADATGGISESTANPIYGFKKAAEASENYYVVYYRPNEYKEDGKYKEIKVKVKGGRYRVTHRAGYIDAGADVAAPTPPDEYRAPTKAEAVQVEKPVLKEEAALTERPAPKAPEPGAAIDLGPLLKKTADYCARLQSAALEFVCRESIEESQAIPLKWSKGGLTSFAPARLDLRNQKRAWLYDYQLVQKGGAIEERRTLLEENGKPRRMDGASLKDLRFWHKRVIQGPIGLFGAAAQPRQAYRRVGEDMIDGARIDIVEVVPREGQEGGLYGKAWIRRSDAAILRIEWSPESMGDYEGIMEYARQVGGDAHLTFASEYGQEKGGIRFPTAYRVTEAYALPLTSELSQALGRRVFTRSTTAITYSDYKYFTVETDVRIR